MSFQAMTEVRAVKDISATARLVLFVVAQYAGADGVCHPSQATIAEDSGLSERAVRKAMQELREAGVLETDRRCRRNGSRTSDQITLLYYQPREERDDGARVVRKRPEATEANRHDMPVHIEGDDRHDMPVANRHETSTLPAPDSGPTTFEPVRESTDRMTDVILSERASECADDGFETALAAYPITGQRVTATLSAKVAWVEAVTQAGGIERLTAAVRAFAADPVLKRRDFGAPSFQRWLSEGRWRAYLPGPTDTTKRGAWTGPAAVREAVAAAMGSPAVASYLDPARWDDSRKAILTQTRFAAERLAEGARRALEGLGVTVEFDAAGSAQRG